MIDTLQELIDILVVGGHDERFHFTDKIMLPELQDWTEYYTPPKNVPKDGLIVDIGAREGDTAVFYFLLGYKNLRLVEAWNKYYENLHYNVEILKLMGANIDLRLAPATFSCLDGAAFIKFDCEGCEYEFDLDKIINIPYIAELHEKHAPVDNGRYNYSVWLGYKRWIPRELTEKP